MSVISRRSAAVGPMDARSRAQSLSGMHKRRTCARCPVRGRSSTRIDPMGLGEVFIDSRQFAHPAASSTRQVLWRSKPRLRSCMSTPARFRRP